MIFNFKNKIIFPNGFSLIELLIAVSIFSIISVIAMGALYSVQNVNTRTQQTQMILDGMNLSMEEMVRDIRYGDIFNCGTDSSNLSLVTIRNDCNVSVTLGNVLVFKPSGSASDNDRIAYYLSNDGHIMRWSSSTATNSQVTAGDVNIKTLHFFVEDTGSVQDSTPDYEQPLITIIVSGVTVPPKSSVLPVKFNLQTSVSARRLDN